MKFGSRKREAITDGISLDLAIDEHNLNREIMDQPLLYRKYSDLDSEAQKALKAGELYLDQMKAATHLRIIQEGGKHKVDDVKAMVLVDPEVRQATAKVLELQEQADKIRGALKACYQRHEALKDLAANKRKELV